MTRATVSLLAAVAVAGLLASSLANGAFPVRFDPSKPVAPTALVSGAVAISSGPQYRKTIDLSVTPDTAEDFLQIEASTTATITGRVALTSYAATGSIAVLREYRIIYRKLAGQPGLLFNIEHEKIGGAIADDLTLEASTTADPITLTLGVDTPPDHDRVIIDAEIFVSTAGTVTFTELY